MQNPKQDPNPEPTESRIRIREKIIPDPQDHNNGKTLRYNKNWRVNNKNWRVNRFLHVNQNDSKQEYLAEWKEEEIIHVFTGSGAGGWTPRPRPAEGAPAGDVPRDPPLPLLLLRPPGPTGARPRVQPAVRGSEILR